MLLKKALFAIIFVFSLISCSEEKPGVLEPKDGETTGEGPAEGGEEETAVLSDVELIDKLQQQTFKYFWDFAEPISGLARERSGKEAYGGQSRNIVTIGGSGFGLASFPAAVERGWITRGQALERLNKILNFLETVPTYHGAFSHWYYADVARTKPFGNMDDGGDLVETALLIQGLLINLEYFSGNSLEEQSIRNRITKIWEAVEWSWYTQGENVLYWHWSPNYGFEKNLKIKGWNEALIVYVLAASSPTYPISAEVYHQGWASEGNMVKSRKYYGISIDLGPDYGGPLFFAHYSFIGLDPRNLQDRYASYWEQNVAHALVNYNYCADNPRGYEGYGEKCWGLTASDDYSGYTAHSPANDTGVIAPTAALSSFPYTPEKSMKALRYFYEELGDKLWGEYGFYDAFSQEVGWYSKNYLAIDQGPIVAMIENYRTGLLWELFMANHEIKTGLDKLGFSY